MVGVDDVMRGKGLVEFIVRGDGRILWRSGTMRGGQAARQVDVALKGVRMMELDVTGGGNGIGQDHVNWADPVLSFTGPIRAFMQQPCRVQEGTDLALGGILCHWPDNNVGEQMNVYRQSPVMPALVAYAERIWRGAQNNREDAWAKLPPPDDAGFERYAAFEADMLAHRDRYFDGWPFTCTPIAWDGKQAREVEGLSFRPWARSTAAPDTARESE